MSISDTSGTHPVLSPGLAASDSSLVRYLRTGEDQAAEELYHRYAKRLKRIVSQRSPTAFTRRFDAEDIVQSVFRAFFQRIQANQYEVPEGGEIWSLLYVIAINKLHHQISHHKAAKRNVYRTSEVEDQSEANLFSDDAQSSVMLRLVVEEYLSKLSEPDRAIIGMRMTGHSIAEIAQHTGRAVRSVERVLQKSRDQLAELIQD